MKSTLTPGRKARLSRRAFARISPAHKRAVAARAAYCAAFRGDTGAYRRQTDTGTSASWSFNAATEAAIAEQAAAVRALPDCDLDAYRALPAPA